ncbi:MAG: hypothetical protein ABSG57_01155 [Candidatus Bathyarchaeia archaeon]
MLRDEDANFLILEITTKYESEWEKIDRAIDNIKLGDMKTEFSLPIEISETLDEMPRKGLRSGRGYNIFVSSKKITLQMDFKVHKTSIPPEKEAQPPREEILREAQSNFNLFLGVFLGASAKVVESANVKLTARFEVPLKEYLVSEIDFPLVKKLKSQRNEFTFGLREIMVSQESTDKKQSYDILEDMEKNLLKIELITKFKTSPATIELAKLVQDSIKDCNEFLSILKG